MSHEALGRDVERSEEITTFVLHESRLNKRTGRIRHEHLQPRRVNHRLETSVYRTKGISPREVWSICERHFDKAPQQMAKARGVGDAVAFYDAVLTFDADGNPHPRHANVIGWLDEAGKKHAWKQQAINVAQHMLYELRPSASVARTLD